MKTDWHFSFIALIISLCLLPWYVVRFQLAGIPITVLEVSILLTGFIWLAETLHNGHLWLVLKSYWLNSRWLVVWSGLLVISTVLAVIVAPDLRAAFGIAKAYIVEPVILSAVAVCVIGTDRRRWWLVLAALLVAGLQIIGVGLSQAVFSWPNIAPAELSQGRVSSFFNTANAVGLFLGPLVGLVAATLIGRFWRGWKRLILATWLGLSIITVLLSRSDGAAISLAVIAVYLLCSWVIDRYKWWPFIAQRWWKLGVVVVVIAYAVGCIAFVWWFNHPPEVANPYTRPNFSTFTVRQCTWEGTRALLSKEPISGAGLSGFTEAYLNNATCDAEPLVYPHMLVLNFWSELGLLGLISTLGLMSWWFWVAGDLIKTEATKWIGIGLSAALVYWLLHGLVDVPYFKNDLSVLWWVCTALLFSAKQALAANKATE